MPPLAVQTDLARFLALVRRELAAREVNVFRPSEVPTAPDVTLDVRCALPDGHVVVVRYDEPPAERDALQRRLEILASTFGAVVDEAAPEARTRAPVGRELREELQKVCERAAALNALVIDANSPILWGAARPRDVAPEAWTAFDPRGEEDALPDEHAAVAFTSRKALEAVRNLVDMAAVRKGKRARHVEREGDVRFVAHSFAGIYLLILVFAAPFDELRAERAILESIARVEKWVLALPPLDPPPEQGVGVISMRRPRRR